VVLTKSEIAKLDRIMKLAGQLLERSKMDSKSRRTNGKATRTRRTGRQLIAFRKMLKAERRKGISVAALARKHGVSSAYIYMLP
jgi:hypothetical protein